MRRSVLLLLVAVLAAPGTLAVAGSWEAVAWHKGDPDWRGFPVGTQVEVRRMTTLEVPGLSGARTIVMAERRTLIALDATAASVRIERKLGVAWLPGIEWKPSLKPVDVGPLGPPARFEDVQIGGKSYPCAVHEDVLRVRNDRHERATLWIHDTHGVLRFEGVLSADSGTSIRWWVTDLDVRRTVGGRSFAGREITLEGRNVKGTVVLSTAVPGGMIDSLLEVSMGAAHSQVRETLVSFGHR